MDSNLRERAKKVAGAFQEWLHKPDTGLIEAKEQTVHDHYFAAHDVDYSLRCFEQEVTEESLLSWLDDQIPDQSVIIPQKILCLHAGNLPMVGLQDVLACLILGHKYYGKISRKDPHLIPSFLTYWEKQHPDDPTAWSTDLEKYYGLVADAVLFSGSAETVPEVRKTLREGKMVGNDTKYLIRTAHFSIAYLDRNDPAYIKTLAGAIARYEGKGCRSVAIVVSPVSLLSIQDDVRDAFAKFWNQNPPASKRKARLQYRAAYNEAIQRPHVMLDTFLIEENDPDPEDDVIYWLDGRPEDVCELAYRFSGQIQNIYVTNSDIAIPDCSDFSGRIELLGCAQCPSISWKPDGVDVLRWLSGFNQK